MKYFKYSPSDNLQRYWTEQAIECYYLGGVCSKCSLPDRYKKECKMRSSIISLVREEIPIPERLRQKRKDVLDD